MRVVETVECGVSVDVRVGVRIGVRVDRIEAHSSIPLVVEEVDDEPTIVSRHRRVRIATGGTGFGRVLGDVHSGNRSRLPLRTGRRKSLWRSHEVFLPRSALDAERVEQLSADGLLGEVEQGVSRLSPLDSIPVKMPSGISNEPCVE